MSENHLSEQQMLNRLEAQLSRGLENDAVTIEIRVQDVHRMTNILKERQ